MKLIDKPVAKMVYDNRQNYINVPGINEYLNNRITVASLDCVNIYDSMIFRPLSVRYNNYTNLSYGLNILLAEYRGITQDSVGNTKYVFNFNNTSNSLYIPTNLLSNFSDVKINDKITLVGYYYFTHHDKAKSAIYFSPLEIHKTLQAEMNLNIELYGRELSNFDTNDIIINKPIYLEFKNDLEYRTVGIALKLNRNSIIELVRLHNEDVHEFFKYLDSLIKNHEYYINGEVNDNKSNNYII